MIGKETSIIDNVMLLYITNNNYIIYIIYTSYTCVPMCTSLGDEVHYFKSRKVVP